ncbi:synaptonemal complex protein 1-like [Artemia franciscana]|uniref:synaptonemal complex protein 1-like n=1 Tax=Artemia franciscana TaxID=6661 RepID=UPI0032DAA731
MNCSEVDLPVVDTILQHVENIFKRIENSDKSRRLSLADGSNSEISRESGVHSQSLSQFEILNSTLQSNIRKLRESNFELQRKLDEKEEELAEQAKNSDRLLSQIRQDLSHWRQKYAALLQDRQEDKVDLQTIKTYIATLPTHDELLSQKMEVGRCHVEIKDLSGKVEDLKIKLNCLSRENEALNKEKTNLESMRTDDGFKIEELITKLKEERESRTPVTDLEKEYKKMKDELDLIRKVAAHREKRFKAYREETENKLADLQGRRNELEEKLSSNENMVSLKTKEMKLLQDSIKKLQEENNKLQNGVFSLQRQLNQYQNQAETRQEELELSNLVALKAQCSADELSTIVDVVKCLLQGEEASLEKLLLPLEAAYLRQDPIDCLKALLVSGQCLSEISKSLSYLRTVVSEQYGKKVGKQASNVTCIQQ